MRYTYFDLLEQMINLKKLAVLPESCEICGSFSSYDRASYYDIESDKYIEWGANTDCDGCIRKEGDRSVVFEMTGPGVIWRVWSANPQNGNIRIYTENEKNEKLCMPFHKFFEQYAFDESHIEWPANYPNLMPILSRGRNRLIPIPFNEYCKITFDPDWGSFYQFTYTKFPKGTELPEYSIELEKESQIMLAELDRKFHIRGENPYDGLLNIRENTIVYANKVKANSDSIIFKSLIPGAITKIKLNTKGTDKKTIGRLLENVYIDILWDNEDTSSVNCSISSFFASVKESSNFKTWPVAIIGNEFSAYWYMPYHVAEIKVFNSAEEDIYLNIEIDYCSIRKEEAEQFMRFHAKQHSTDYLYLEKNRYQKNGDRWPDWPLLLTKGTGRFCGIHMAIDNRFELPEEPPREWWYGVGEEKTINWWWGEGDEKFFVDGEKFPSTFGTGSEDYIGYAWAAEPPHVLFDSAYSVQNAVPIDGNGMTSLARFHICDNIPFLNSFEGFIEKYYDSGWAKNAICEFSVTPFWYLKHDGKHIDYYNNKTNLDKETK